MSAAALQKLERIHVMKCAKDITGSDKPRKLAPAVRAKVCMLFLTRQAQAFLIE
jgi:hypothetical protein